MTALDIFRVLYAPHKAFKEIIQSPKYTGPILIMLLFVAANSLAAYILGAKTYIEGTHPQTEHMGGWTESASLWTASINHMPFINSPVIENQEDYISGASYGNRSIEFQAENCTYISMKVDLGNVNCSIQGGYEKLYLRVKLASPPEQPAKVFLHLYSTYPSNYFSKNLTGKFLNTPDVWNNLTIPLADSDWESFNGDWSKIACLSLEFAWEKPSKVRILLDGLFFGGIFKSYMENVAAYIANYAAYAFMQFVIRWVMLGGFIYIMSKAFRANTAWRVMLILAGFALITMFIQALINAAAFSSLPNLNYPFELTGGVKGEGERAYSEIMEQTSFVNQIYSYTSIAIMLWTILLCAVALRLSTGFPWTTSLLIAVIANFVMSFIERFLTAV